MFYEIKLGTVTRAQNTIYILKKYGIKGSIGRNKNPEKSEGCGYTVKVKTDNINYILALIKKNGIDYYGVDTA